MTDSTTAGRRGTAVVTGASSGIGAATAIRLTREGFAVVLGARRADRLAQVASACGPSARALPLDVTDPESVEAFCAGVGECQVLINNAGGASGLDPIARAVEEDWQRMYDTNVMGTMRMTKALLPALAESGDGHVVVIGSIASHEPYPGGGGYNAAKFAARAFTAVLRREVLGQPVRVTEIDPGMVETEFSLVRFDGDADRAAAVYDGVTPLIADDIADCVAFAVTRPSHVNIDSMIVLARDQAGAREVHRHP